MVHKRQKSCFLPGRSIAPLTPELFSRVTLICWVEALLFPVIKHSPAFLWLDIRGIPLLPATGLECVMQSPWETHRLLFNVALTSSGGIWELHLIWRQRGSWMLISNVTFIKQAELICWKANVMTGRVIDNINIHEPSLFRRIRHVLKLCDKVLSHVFYFQEYSNLYYIFIYLK